MAYYLKHYFDPDFKHEKLTPSFTNDGSVTFFYLGYVQNVVVGQVLAELIDLDANPGVTDYDPRFIFDKPYFPCGPNCAPHPGKPTRIISKVNGYCFYHEGLITVKKLLNIRRDVDFHTGTVMFVGDVIAHEAIRSGFTLHGNNILVKGTIEDSVVKASGNIVCEAGIKGGGNGRLESGGNIKLPFCERIQLASGGNIEIDGSCMHSSVASGGSLMVKGRLQGGDICVKRIIFVQDQLGGGQDTITRITIGYSPEKVLQLREAELELEQLVPKLEHLELIVEKKPERLELHSFKIRLLRRRIKARNAQIRKLKQELEQEALSLGACKIICPGKIRPGVEINIAGARMVVDDFYSNLEFKLDGEDIVFNKLS